jgi:hypothetical protein
MVAGRSAQGNGVLERGKQLVRQNRAHAAAARRIAGTPAGRGLVALRARAPTDQCGQNFHRCGEHGFGHAAHFSGGDDEKLLTYLIDVPD